MAAETSAAALPAALEEAKAYLTISGSEEDALLAAFMSSATELCEAFTNVVLIRRDVRETIPLRPLWTRLSLAPVSAIVGLSKLDAAGVERPLPTEAYSVDINAAGEGWVRTTRSDNAGRGLVHYRAGQAADWNGVPEPLRQGIVRLAAHLYTYRHEADGAAPPAAVTALWLPYRRLRLC